jgi:LacI family transcriptional regulator
MVRLKDIAQQAGVSVMTVSKVLRDEPDISAATKARVRALAQEMGYVPDAMAQSLRTRSTRLIGLVIPAVTNPIFARLILAVEERAHLAGFDLVFAHTLNRIDREESVLRRLISRRVGGLLVFPVQRLDPVARVYQELQQHRIPTVILGPLAPFSAGFVNVQADDIQGGTMITRHLLELGHHRIAFLAGPPAAGWAQERFVGYQYALREAGLTTDDRLIFQAGGTLEEGEKAALEMLQERADATAVVAVNDLVAIGAANAFINQGLRIPDDLSVAGFGNVLTSNFFRVPLTTIRQPKHGMGLAAMDILETLMKGERAESRRLPTSVLIRSSTANPPATPRLPHTVTPPVT